MGKIARSYARKMSVDNLKIARSYARNAFRAVHILRDPYALAISAYLYHLGSNDGAPNNATRTMSMVDGLAVEVQHILETTLPRMLDVYLNGSVDGDVLHVRMENFTRSSTEFNATVHEVYAHMIGDIRDSRTMSVLLERAVEQDMRNSQFTDAAHVSPFRRKLECATALRKLPRDLLSALNMFRLKLGYTMVGLSDSMCLVRLVTMMSGHDSRFNS